VRYRRVRLTGNDTSALWLPAGVPQRNAGSAGDHPYEDAVAAHEMMIGSPLQRETCARSSESAVTKSSGECVSAWREPVPPTRRRADDGWGADPRGSRSRLGAWCRDLMRRLRRPLVRLRQFSSRRSGRRPFRSRPPSGRGSARHRRAGEFGAVGRRRPSPGDLKDSPGAGFRAVPHSRCYPLPSRCRRRHWEELMNRRPASVLAGVVIAASPALAVEVTPERLVNGRAAIRCSRRPAPPAPGRHRIQASPVGLSS
jgi:hypothetical protein